MNISGNTILITGGGSGIGRAQAEALHARGNQIIIAGRRERVLDEVTAANPGMASMLLDIQDRADIEAFARQTVERFPELNAVLNNAGIMKPEDIPAGISLAIAEETIATNLLGPIRLTNALVDHLKDQSDAVLVNVTSGLAFVPLTDAPTYCATKAAIHSYTVSLREELRGKVEVIELPPPAVQTGLTPGQETRPGYQPLDEFADEVMTLFAQDPTPQEILVERLGFLRNAEREGRFDETLTQLNAFARKAREG